MGAETKWCHYTVSPWKVKGESRVVAAESAWRRVLQWDRKAACQCGGGFRGQHSPYCPQADRPRVFCAVDVFEDWQGEMVNADGLPLIEYTPKGCASVTMQSVRNRLFELIGKTPNLDWLLLTRRPENVLRMTEVWKDGWPENVWPGTSVENQGQAVERISKLLKIPAKVLFLSMEPLLERVDLFQALPPEDRVAIERGHPVPFDWVIVGGQSGRNARPMHPGWVRSIRDQCQEAGVPFFFKQWGEWRPINHYGARDPDRPGYRIKETDYGDDKPQISVYMPGFDMSNFIGWFEPDGERYCVGTDNPNRVAFVRVGKKAAGRILDGRTWDEVPKIP